MSALVPPEVRSRVVAIVDALVNGRFDVAAAGGRCRGEDLRRRIEEYGRTLRALPATALDVVDACARADGSTAIDVPLWTLEEGRSDLELRIGAAPMSDGWSVVVEDLLVP